MAVRFDDNGKVDLDHIYVQPDPRAYFTTLRRLGYCIPELAKPYFVRIIQQYRDSCRVRVPNVLDLGASYGINAALLGCDTTMDELYQRYGDPHAHVLTREQLLAQDRELVRARSNRRHARFVGLDSSRPALTYAVAAGLLDDAVDADLESSDPTARQQEQLASTDLVISTGCIGYVSEKTISRIIGLQGDRRPWMAHFVLRMFPFEPVVECLAESGYETVQVDRVFRQRRFASAQEQTLILGTLATVGVDPRGLEADGWLYAQLYVSRPRGTRTGAIVDLAPSNTADLSEFPHHRGQE